MIKKVVNTTGSGFAQFNVPEGATAIAGFVAICDRLTNGALEQTFESNAILVSPTPAQSWAAWIGGTADWPVENLLAVANRQLVPIPVSAGESLMVVFELTGSAIIYFDDTKIGS